MVLFTASNTSFFALPVTSSTSLSQTDIFEDLFRLKELTVKADNIKKYQKTIKELLLIETKVIEQREKTNNQKIASIENLKANMSILNKNHQVSHTLNASNLTKVKKLIGIPISNHELVKP